LTIKEVITVSIEHRRESARQRLKRRFARSDKSDAELADSAITEVHNAVIRSGEPPLTDAQAADIVAEDARQMRAEKRAGQHVS
jgi:hypothetical protein